MYKICRYHPHDVYQFLLLCRRISRLRPHPCKRPFNDFYRATIEHGHTQYKILEIPIANPQTMVAVCRYLYFVMFKREGWNSNPFIDFWRRYPVLSKLSAPSPRQHISPSSTFPSHLAQEYGLRKSRCHQLPTTVSVCCHSASTPPRRQCCQNHSSRFLCRH